MPIRGTLSRRGFLQRSLGGLTAAGLPLWYANELIVAAEEKAAEKKPRAANGRINVGIIGIDNKTRRSVALYQEAKKLNTKGKSDVLTFVALCDVDANHLKNGQEMLKKDGFETKGYKDYREMLQDKDIDAVLIAVPDQWHALIAVEAMKRGKDVYCEKPLTLTVDEGKKMVECQKKTGRVFQTGSQQRTEMRGMFRLAAEVVRAGRLGKIGRIECRIGTNPKSGPIAKAPVPEGLDWDFWLGPCPKVDYLYEKRGNQEFTNCHYEYRWWYEYSGGKMTDWGAHHLDIAQWALGMDGNGPVEVEGHGEEPSKDPHAFNCHPTFEVAYTYANGAKVFAVSHDQKKDKRFTDGKYGNGLIIEGQDGKWVFVSRGTIEASDKAILSEALPADFKPLYEGRPISHMANFVECIKSRKAPICDVGIGHSSVTICHIGTISRRLGKKLRWEPLKQEFLGDAEANKMLSRPMREPWKLEV
jgi:predicted dehydrogenase